MGCNTYLTARDSQLFWQCVEALKNAPPVKLPGLSPQIWEGAKDQVRQAMNERLEQMLGERNDKFVDKSRTFKLTPEEKEILKESRNRDEVEKNQTIRDLKPVKALPEERCTIREAGEKLGLKPSRVWGTPYIARFPAEKVETVLACLNDSKVPKCFTRTDTIGQVQYVDRQLRDRDGHYIRGCHQSFTDEDGKTQHVIYIFRDNNNQFPAEEDLRGVIAHEVAHANWGRIEEYIKEQEKEFTAALDSQLEKGLPSEYALNESKDNIEEWVTECYRFYVADQSRLSNEMVNFFDGLSEHFSAY